MENNKTSASLLLEEIENLHDSNIENILIFYRTFGETGIDDYPKEITDIQIKLQLPIHSDIRFSKKNIKILFSDVKEYYIEKNSNWSWLILSAFDKKENDGFNRFIIDNYFNVIYKHFRWDFIDNNDE